MRFSGLFCYYSVSHCSNKPTIKIIDWFLCQWANVQLYKLIYFFPLCVYIYIYMYIHTHIFMYTHTHTHPHTHIHIYISAFKVTCIHFNGNNFFNAQLKHRIFSVWPVAQPIVGAMEMHSVATWQHCRPLKRLFHYKTVPKPYLVSENRWYCRVSAKSFIFIPLSDNRSRKIYQRKPFLLRI